MYVDSICINKGCGSTHIFLRGIENQKYTRSTGNAKLSKLVETPLEQSTCLKMPSESCGTTFSV